MASMEEIAYGKGTACTNCPYGLDFYEGEWFGGALEYDCVKKN